MKFAILLMALAAGLPVPAPAGTPTNSVPLPRLDYVLSRAAEAVGREDYYRSSFNQHYAYRRSRINEVWYSNGQLKAREEKFNTNSPPPEIASLPLPTYHPSADAANPDGKQLINVTELVTNVLAQAKLTLVGRTMLDGRSTLVVEFQPPDMRVPDNGLINRLINRGAGHAWVDEQDYTLSKLETHLLDKLNIFGGLAGAVYNGSYSFERRRTPEGLWYARTIQWHADVREIFVRRKLDYVEQFMDVHKPVPAAVAATTR